MHPVKNIKSFLNNIQMNKMYFVICTILMFVSCTPKAYIPFDRTGEVTSTAGDKSTITLVSTGYASDANTANLYAERNALENLLFKGIPGSVLENPMIPDEQKAKMNHGQALENLIIRGGYVQFVIEGYADNTIQQKSGVLVKKVIKFDYNALRKHLEKENIIRGFGL